ncbi:unnamed protein product, partial [Polarella glacialis]
ASMPWIHAVESAFGTQLSSLCTGDLNSRLALEWPGFFDIDRLEDMGKEQVPVLLQSLHGQVLAMALDPRGCRLVQRALELAGDHEQVFLARELRGHVREALESPHANH